MRRENWELDSCWNIFIRHSNVNAATTQQQQKVKHTWRNIVEQNEQNRKKIMKYCKKNFGKFYQKLGEYLFEYLIFECEWKEMKGK